VECVPGTVVPEVRDAFDNDCDGVDEDLRLDAALASESDRLDNRVNGYEDASPACTEVRDGLIIPVMVQSTRTRQPVVLASAKGPSNCVCHSGVCPRTAVPRSAMAFTPPRCCRRGPRLHNPWCWRA
jgi:hypothetical protein